MKFRSTTQALDASSLQPIAPAAAPMPQLPQGHVERSPVTRYEIAGRRYDAADRLPPRARATLLRLRDESAEAYAILRSVSDKRTQLIQDKISADALVRRVTEGLRHTYPPLSPDEVASNKARVDAKERLDWIVAEFERVDIRYEQLAAKATTLGSLLQNNVAPFLKNLPANALVNDAEPVAVPKSATLDKVRADVQRTKDKLKSIKKAPVTAAMAKAAATAYIDSLAEKGAPDVLNLIDHGEREPRWNTIRLKTLGNEAAMTKAVDPLATMAWLFRDQMLKAMHAEIDLRADPEHELTDEQRAAALEQTAAELLRLERVECAICESIGAALRPDVSPLAALSIEVQ